MGRNIVLIVLDTVRKDYFDQNAHRLFSLSDVTYSQCRSASSWSVPSHASIFTGELPHKHGIHAENISFSELSIEDTFMHELSDYRRIGISTNLFASNIFGFDTLFDEFYSLSRHSRFAEGMDMDQFLDQNDEEGIYRYKSFLSEAIKSDHTFKSIANGVFVKINSLAKQHGFRRMSDYGASATLDKALKTVDNRNTFMFINLMEAHTPHENNIKYSNGEVEADWSSDHINKWEVNNDRMVGKFEEDLENYQKLYSKSIEYMDEILVEFINKFEKKTSNETTFIITSDHGENLGYEGDNELLDHIGELNESLLHVPQIIINPPKGFKNEYDRYFSHIDLGELIVEISNGNSPNLTKEKIAAERIGLGIFSDPENYEYWDRMIRCGYNNNTKFEWDSLGNSYKYELDSNRPCYQELIEEDISPPEDLLGLFSTDMMGYKQDQLTTDSNDDFSDVEDRLRELGYL